MIDSFIITGIWFNFVSSLDYHVTQLPIKGLEDSQKGPFEDLNKLAHNYHNL